MRRISIPIIALLTLVSLAGCWDQTQIEEVGFVLAVGLDPADDEKKKNTADHPFLRATYQVAIPGKIQSKEGGKTGKAFFNISSTGMTNFKIRRQVSSRRSRYLKYEHLKIILFHQELARKGTLEHLIDYYLRDHEMRRRTLIFITEDDTRDILELKLPLEEILSSSIKMISENETRILGMMKEVNIGDVSKNIIGKEDFLIPRIIKGESDLSVNGAALFTGKTNKMLDWLGTDDIEAYNWIMGEAGTGVIEILYEDKDPFVFESTQQDTKITYKRTNEINQFDINIRAEGVFAENWIHKLDLSDEENLAKLEKMTEQRIEEQTNKLVEKLQHEFYTEIFGLSEEVKKENYPYWKEIKDKWTGENGEFSKAKINIEADIQIRHYMLNERLDQ